MKSNNFLIIMNYFISLMMISLLLSACSKTTFYIVRHAEKETALANMSSDVELTPAGKQRAEKLNEMLNNKNIGYIFSTSTIRTTSTAKPLSESINIPIQFYNHRDTIDRFISRLKSIKHKNVLIVGHSNTVDDLVNKMMNTPLLTDLNETEYSNLFIITRKGKKYNYSRKSY